MQAITPTPIESSISRSNQPSTYLFNSLNNRMAILFIDSFLTADSRDFSPTDPSPDSSSLTSYTPIGFGKPLSVEILSVYTGAFKTKVFGGDKHDVLCVSGAKAPETFNACPRAINLLEQKQPGHTYLEFTAFQAATPYVYYKKAVDSSTIEITIELVASSFNQDLVNAVTGLLKTTASLPIFMPAEGKLMAGAQLVDIIAHGANDLFAPDPFLSETITLRFDTAGMPVNTARLMVLCRDQDQAELGDYQAMVINKGGNTEMRLTKDGAIYTGDAPYVLVNVDGAQKPALESWTATLASSSILGQFYATTNAAGTTGAIVQQAMSLYNDYTYRTKADALKQQLATTDPNSSLYQQLQTQYQAYVKNITSDYFAV